MSRSRSPSESNDMEALGGGGMCDVADVRQGVSYDMDGKFSIEAEKNQLLVIKMVGYVNQEVLVEGSGSFEFYLKNETLKEMVVVGYGSQESEDVTGSIVQVDSKQIMQTAVAGAADALQGRAAGVATEVDDLEVQLAVVACQPLNQDINRSMCRLVAGELICGFSNSNTLCPSGPFWSPAQPLL